MATIKGICRNEECVKLNEIQEVEETEFICPGCGEPLFPFGGGGGVNGGFWKKHGKKVIGGIVVALLAAGGACVALLGGGETPPPPPQVDTPVINPESGEYKNTIKVTLDCATDSVNIYYTLNGEEPSDVSALYSEPIQIDKSTTIKVIACRPGYINSNVSVAEFTISKGKNPNPTGDGSGKRYKGTLNLGYGRYSGDIVDGKPDGAGVLTYTKQQKVVSTKDVVAEPGERIEGVFENGKASFVTLYKKDGNTIKVHR